MTRRLVYVVAFAGLVGASLLAIRIRVADSEATTVDEVRQRIEALKTERGQLQEDLRGALPEDARLVGAPEGDVLVGLPSRLVEGIVSEALSGPLRNVRLLLSDVVKVERSDVIRTRTFLGAMTLGKYDLFVNVQEVDAIMKPGKPKLVFGANRITIELPVRVESGNVKAKIVFKWDGRRLAGVVCGDLNSEHDLRATIPPLELSVRGRFEVMAMGEQFVVRPVLAPLEMSFNVEPPQKTWDFLDDLIESKNVVCEAAIRKAAVGQKVKDLVARGFKFMLPTNWVRSIRLPATFTNSFDVKGTSAGLAVMPKGVSITKTRIWYGADVTLRKERKGVGRFQNRKAPA
jgi:hypothetical protein